MNDDQNLELPVIQPPRGENPGAILTPLAPSQGEEPPDLMSLSPQPQAQPALPESQGQELAPIGDQPPATAGPPQERPPALTPWECLDQSEVALDDLLAVLQPYQMPESQAQDLAEAAVRAALNNQAPGWYLGSVEEFRKEWTTRWGMDQLDQDPIRIFRLGQRSASLQGLRLTDLPAMMKLGAEMQSRLSSLEHLLLMWEDRQYQTGSQTTHIPA